MSKDSDPRSSRFNRYVTVPTTAIVVALGASACGDKAPSEDSCEFNTYTVGVDGDNLMQIAEKLLEDSGDTSITQKEKDTQVANLQVLNGLNGTIVSEGKELTGMVCYNWDQM